MKILTKSGFVLISVFLMITALMAVLGASSLSVSYKGQLIGKYIDGIKAYYLAVTGVQYARQHYYDDYDYTIKPAVEVKQADISLSGYAGSISVKRNSDKMNADIESIGKFGRTGKTILCRSGDERMTLGMEQGLIGAFYPGQWGTKVINRYIGESDLPVTKWQVKSGEVKK